MRLSILVKKGRYRKGICLEGPPFKQTSICIGDLMIIQREHFPKMCHVVIGNEIIQNSLIQRELIPKMGPFSESILFLKMVSFSEQSF